MVVKYLKRKLEFLERSTALTTQSGHSICLTFAKKARRLAEYLSRRLLVSPDHGRMLRQTSRLKNSLAGKDALVLGNGPSVHNLDLQSVRLKQASGLQLFVVNWFPLSDLSKELTPDFLVLSDPLMRPDNLSERNESLWRYISSNRELMLAIPTTWRRHVRQVGVPADRILYFNDLPLEGFGKGTSPLKPRRYLSLTVYKALAISVFLGFERIFVLGVDNTMFKGLTVDRDNDLILGDHHFYSKQRPDSNLTYFYPNGVADYFFDISMCFFDLKRYFSRHGNIYNLDYNSLVDSFKKDDPLALFRTTTCEE